MVSNKGQNYSIWALEIANESIRVLPVIYNDTFCDDLTIFMNDSLWTKTISNNGGKSNPPITTFGEITSYKNPYNKIVDKLNKIEWDGMNKDESLGWFKKIDLQGLFKSVFPYPKSKRKKTFEFFCDKNNVRKEKLKIILDTLIKWRNQKQAHISASYMEEIDEEYFREQILKPIKEYCELMRNNKNINSLTDLIADISRKIKYPDFTVDELEEGTGLTRDVIIEALKELNLIVEDGNTIKGQDRDRLVNLILAVCKGSEDSNITKQLVSDEAIQLGVDKKESKAPEQVIVDDFMKNISKHLLAESDLDIITSQYNIVLDSSAFLNEHYSKVVMNILGPRLKHKGRTALVFRRTRVDLYNGMKNYYKNKNKGIEDCDNPYLDYKTAVNKLDLLVKSRVVSYAAGFKDSVNEEDDINRLIATYPNKKILLVTSDDIYVDKRFVSDTAIVMSARCIENRIYIRQKYLEKIKNIAQTAENEKKGNLQQKNQAENKKDVLQSTKIKKASAEKASVEKASAEKVAAVVENQKVELSNGASIYLRKVLGSGGEGTVYATDVEGIVAKIYHVNKINKKRKEKLRYMVTQKNDVEGIVWPINLVMQDDEIIGYTMREVPPEGVELGLSIMKMSNKYVQKEVLKEWKRREIVECAIAIIKLFNELHKKDILMGDINPRNIIINPNKPSEVWFVDCDSYQMGTHLCPVGTAIFTSPRIYNDYGISPDYSKFKRTIEDERYAIASLLFQILMLGQQPFASKRKDDTSIEEAIKTYKFSYSKETDEDMPDGPYRMIWYNLIGDIKERFESVFAQGKSVDENSWIEALQKYVYCIDKEYVYNELFPIKYRSQYGKYIDYKCEICRNEVNMSEKKYKRLVAKGKPLYCNNCAFMIKDYRNKKVTVKCTRCNKEDVVVNEEQKIINEYRKSSGRSVMDFLCKSCMEEEKNKMVTTQCDICGVDTVVPNKVLMYVNRQKLKGAEYDPIMCKDCYRRKKGY